MSWPARTLDETDLEAESVEEWDLPRRSHGWADVVGAGLWALTCLWLVLSPAIGRSNSALMIVVSGITLIAARLIGRVSRILVPTAVLLVAVIIGLQFGYQLLNSHPLAGPFHYVNATGTFFALASIAGLMLASGGRGFLGKGLGVLAAAGFAIVPLINGSAGASIVLAAVVLLGLAAAGPRAARWMVGLVTLLVVATLALTIILSSDPAIRTSETFMSRTLSQRRLILWNDAYSLMIQNPINGVGLGGFYPNSDAAQADSSSPWAHHEFLQLGAETGVAGLMLVSILFIWVLIRIWMNPWPSRYTFWSAGAVALLALLACIDAVVHFLLIPVAASALAGAAMAKVTDRTEFSRFE